MTLPAEGTSTVGERYVLGEVIGRGGMAEVYRATDTKLKRQVAVKLLREATGDPSDRARFMAEAKTLARLNHAGLVTVLDAGTAAERPFLVMELIDGPNLGECCTGTALHMTRVVAVGTQVADGLAHAHAAGVVHRDVKPSNVMLGRDGRVWLTDFGIARLIGDTGHLTRTGMTIGTPAYLAPEQVRGQEVGPPADVYSLGLVLLEMITGRRAYPQAPTEAALARLTTPPEIPEELSTGWRTLLARMTALDPAERPAADRVAHELRRLSDGADATAVTAVMAAEAGPTRLLPRSTPTEAPPALATPAIADHADPVGGRSSSAPRNWTLIAALAGLAVVVLIIAVFVLPGAGSGGGGVPDGVPPALEQPLGELHDAVNGES